MQFLRKKREKSKREKTKNVKKVIVPKFFFFAKISPKIINFRFFFQVLLLITLLLHDSDPHHRSLLWSSISRRSVKTRKQKERHELVGDSIIYESRLYYMRSPRLSSFRNKSPNFTSNLLAHSFNNFLNRFRDNFEEMNNNFFKRHDNYILMTCFFMVHLWVLGRT
jgi:hypothetical protein